MPGGQKFAFFLPNTFTALNMACGFSAILFSFNGKFYNACLALILGAIFDLVDGRLARLTGTQSTFGEQFDSLSDLVCFGVAPAFLVYNCFFSEIGKLGLVVSFFYLLCGALRLARFNSNIEKSIDLHGYTLDDANKKIYSFIKDCFEKKVNIINIITGKGLRSKNTNDPYQSKDLSILKYSIPNFIKNNDELMEIILKIDEDAIDSPLKGNFKIELKRNE